MSPERTLSHVMVDSPPAAAATGEAARFVRTAVVFTAIGIALYAGLYLLSERLVHQHARTNRFFLVQSRPPTQFDTVILGASHAAALGYQDMTDRLEKLTGQKILNLALVGGGARVSRLVFEYFLTRHQTRRLVYVVDSFAFYASTWNEDRLQDTRLFLRAPFDPALASLLLRDPTTRSIGADYLMGFSKINNKDRFAADVAPDEGTRFTRTYRPVKQLDDQRLAYLYPQHVDEVVFTRYFGEFEALLRDAQARGIRVVVVKPPLPERVVSRLPDEARFDTRLRDVLGPLDIPIHDFTHVGNDEKLFYDTDHLNRDGVLTFFERALGPLLSHGM